MYELNYMNGVIINNANNDDYSFRYCENLVINNACNVSLYMCNNVMISKCTNVSAYNHCTNLMVDDTISCSLYDYCSALALSAKKAYIKNCDFSRINYNDIENLVIDNNDIEQEFMLKCNLRLLNVQSDKQLTVNVSGNIERVLHNRNVSICKK